MFCPVGYVPAAELWTEYVNAHMERLYEVCVEAYNKEGFIPELCRGSPLDICEHLFFEALIDIGIHLASPIGDVMRVHLHSSRGVKHLLSVRGPSGGALLMAAFQIEMEKAVKAESSQLDAYESWDEDSGGENPWASRYISLTDCVPVDRHGFLASLKHHTIPNHFVRHSYIVSRTLENWAIKSASSNNVAPILENFAGWAICVDEKTHSEKWYAHLLPEELNSVGETEAFSAVSGGRPRMVDAQSAFAAMGYAKNGLTWEQVAKKIQRESGVKPSHKAMRNWQNEHAEREKSFKKS